ncbi:MAG: acetylglutamate kinase, partial [Planctomycetes bacterium]|nr:acetylglutamate kinase [Planctomycetota bacterium]
PYIKAFAGKFIVIKLGGSAQENPDVLRNIFSDIDFMLSVGMRPVVVYGGGKRISAAMKDTGKEAKFVHGQRVTDAETIEVASRVLIDEVGQDLLKLMEECGAKGELVNGRDQGLLRAIKKTLPEHPDVDLGYVGEPVAIDAMDIYEIFERRRVPLVAPIACGAGRDSKTLYNVNGDTAASFLARDLHAEKLVLMFDQIGLLRDRSDDASLISHVGTDEIDGLIKDGIIDGGMIPKVQACLFCLEGGVKKAHIVPGAQPHALLLEIFTKQGIGTEIVMS